MDALTSYFLATGDTACALSRRIGRSPSTLMRALKGERDPSMQLARDVERGTGGAVPAIEFLAICLAAAQPKQVAA